MHLSSRNELPQFFSDQGYKLGAEIGVYKGEFTEILCKAGLQVIGIDPWITYTDYRKHPKEDAYEDLYMQSVDRLAPYPNSMLIRKTSMEALEDIPDDSLDFVYIDGNHSLPYVCQDLYGWYRKVRKGGVISGHDYFNSNHNMYWIRACHVKYAVDTFLNILPSQVDLVIFGERDKHPSWLWIKQ